MFRYKNTFGISLILLVTTYGVFGWLYGSWVTRMLEADISLHLLLEPYKTAILYGIGTSFVFLIAIVFTAPVALMTISVNSWLQSDLRAFLSIFFGALIFTAFVQWLDYVAKFLILFASAILVKLDLRTLGVNQWLSQLLLAIMSLGSFFGGILAFDYWR